MKTIFSYERRVAYCDTDAMQVVHHSNYLRYFEEARVAWLREKKLGQFHSPKVPVTLAVLETRCYHFKPAFFDDLLKIQLEVKLERLKTHFQYAVFSERFEQAIATGYTLHIPLDDKLKICRMHPELIKALENERWTETWLSNL